MPSAANRMGIDTPKCMVLALLGLVSLSASAQEVGPKAWANSSGVWTAEVAVLDAARALAPEDREILRSCVWDGLAIQASNEGYSGVEEGLLTPRLYVEVSVLPNEAGFVGYVSIALKSADGKILGPLANIEAPAADTDSLCAAVQDGVAGSALVTG
jgi:hypothetical protein